MDKKNDDQKITIHLLSDATGTTLLGLARACLAQFEGLETNQKFWPLIRTQKQLEKIIQKIHDNPGPVIFTLVDEQMRNRLQERCEDLNVPCIAVLDPIMRGLSSYLGMPARGVPGLQHAMDEAYFKRVAAVDFAMRFDDGKSSLGLKDADVILVGVSRTSKTPTSIFLARRGIKVANIPLVPGVPVPEENFMLQRPLYVGLSAKADRLLELRQTRLKADTNIAVHNIPENEYLDLYKIEDEIKDARKLFRKYNWPVIEVTKRSVEETAAEIMTYWQSHQEKQAQAENG